MKALAILGVISLSLATVVVHAADKTRIDVSALIDTNAKWVDSSNNSPCKVLVEPTSRSGRSSISVGDTEEKSTLTAEGLVERGYNNAYEVTVNELEYQKAAKSGYSFGGKEFFMADVSLGTNGKANKIVINAYRTLPLKYKYIGLAISYVAVHSITCNLTE